MDKGSAIAEQNYRSSRISSKRKRTVSDDLAGATTSVVGDSNTGASSPGSSEAVTKEKSSLSSTTSALPPKPKRARKGVKNSACPSVEGQASTRESVSAVKVEPGEDDAASSNSGDKSRRLNDLVDYFPSFQLGRRLTRSLARELGASSVNPVSSNASEASRNQAAVSESAKTRRNSLSAASSKLLFDSGASSPSGSLVGSSNHLTRSSNSAVKTGCHLSRKTHPSAGATSSSGSGRSNVKGSSSGGVSGENNKSEPMDQDQHHSLASGGGSGSKKIRPHSSQAPSTIPKHGGNHGMSSAGSTLVDLERDGGSSSSDSMDGSSGIGSSAGGGAGGSSVGTGSGGRLHTLLDARNLPMHIFGALGPRMQTLFNRCPSHGGNGSNAGMSNSTSGGGGGRFDSLIQGMQKADDPSAQLQSLIELCNILVMSNEETLGPNFPVKETIRCLIKLLQSEQSYDIMTHACRALTYLMEAAPRVTPAVADAVPLLLDKLQRVECVDVAEQALAALDLLSRRHAKCILTAGGIGACLQYIDFFSLASQRSALQIVANCCLHMTADDFHFLVDSLPALTQRLNTTDKKSVELVCVLFTRLVENYVHEPDKMMRLCDYGLLENVQQMIIASPPILSSTVLVGIIRMMHTLCRQCSELAVRLLRLNVVAAIRFLLMGTADAVAAADAELLARTPQELYELVLLISELLPPLPSDGQLFEVDNWLKACYYYLCQGGRCVLPSMSGGNSCSTVVSETSGSSEHAYWAWKDERGLWRPFAHVDNHLLEAAYQAREDEVSLNTFGQQCTVDLVNMIQVNDETGYSRAVQRKVASPFGGSRATVSKAVNPPTLDPRLELSRTEPKLHEEVVRCLLPVLYDIYTSVGGPAVRHECLRGMLRMIYHSDGELLLRESLKKDAVSSLLAGMLNSNDVKTVVPALQLCTVLMEKLPDVFHVHFRREGVTHQLRRLATETIPFMPSLTTSSAITTAPTAAADGLLSSVASSASLGYASATPSSNSVAGLASASPSSFLDRASIRDTESVGLNAINSVDQFLSAMSGLPLLRHHRHENRHVHHRQQGFDSSTSQPRLTVGDGSSIRVVAGAGRSSDGILTDSATSLLPAAPPSLSAAASASSGATSGAVPKRHHHHRSTSGSTSGGSGATGAPSKTVSGGGHVKTRRAAAAAAIAKQSSAASNSFRGGIGTRSTRMRTSSEAATASQPSSTIGSASATSSEAGGHQHGFQASTASSFFQSLPFPKWARSSGADASQTSTSSSGILHRQTSAPGSKSIVQHLRQKQMAQHTSSSADQAHALSAPSSATTVSSANSPSINAEKCLNWVREQAKTLMTLYFFDTSLGEASNVGGSGDVVSLAARQAANVLERLTALASGLKDGKTEAIYELAMILSSPTNVSCFELLQSGLVGALTEFLVGVGATGERDDRLRAFCKAFFGVECQMDAEEDGVPVAYLSYAREGIDGEQGWLHPARLLLSKLNVSVSQLEQFPVKVHDLAGVASGTTGGLVGFVPTGGAGNFAVIGGPGGGGSGPFGFIGHLSGMAGSAASLRGLSALRFLHSQQIKCHLQRHPEEKRLKQWHRGPIKIDPLAQVVTIEKYLLTKGFGRRCNSSNEEMSGDEDESTDDDDDDDEENPALFLGDLADGAHRLQILINDKVLPYDMTIYQAVRQYGLRTNAYIVGGDSFGTGGGHAGGGNVTSEWIGPELWIHTHLLTYRLAPEAANKHQQATSSSTGAQEAGSTGSGSAAASVQKSSASGRSKSGSKTDKAITTSGAGDVSSNKSSSSLVDFCEWKEPANPLAPYLTSRLPFATTADTISARNQTSATASGQQQQSLQDPSLECINLIRILFGITRYWWVLYKEAVVTNFQPLLTLSEFHNTKLSAKVTRQLQDPLTVVAGQLPNWVEQLTNICSFLFPFEVRLAVFHVVALDRDRALQRLLDSSGEGGGGGGGGSERITPRLERRKVLVSREDILKQAETVLGTMDNSRAVLEIQYENEVGTGLGPTLEFYALVSRQFQRSDLQLWRGLGEESHIAKSTGEKRDGRSTLAKFAVDGGLCPSPLGRHIKSNVLEKVLAKFRLLGKLLGRSLLDGRILDLPLSTVFYKWLVKEEQTLSWADLADLDPTLYRSVQYLRRQQLKGSGLDDHVKMEDARRAVEAMELDFTVPGYPSLELVKNGKDKLVALENLQQYLELLLHWLLKAGVCRQMEAVRDCLNALIPLRHLRLFFPEELDQLFCGARAEADLWEPAVLLQALRPDHGYNHDSPPVRWLVDILATRFDNERRRQFIQFITGSPRLPVGGLKNLNPPLTVVRKTDASNGGNPDAHLPSVMTCVNYLKLPEYTSLEIMEQRLLTAITYGRYSFHLS